MDPINIGPSGPAPSETVKANIRSAIGAMGRVANTAAGFTAANTVLLADQIGVETDTGKFKIGDGATAWNSLSYATVTEVTSLLTTGLTAGNMLRVKADGGLEERTPAQVREDISALGYESSGIVVVDSSGTDSQRGTALVAAYAAAKLLTPNGAALSATNRAQVVIPPGKYKLPSTLTLDTSFVDLTALVPTKPSRFTDAEFCDFAPDPGTTFRPQPTLVYSELDCASTIIQQADDVRLQGFSVAELGPATSFASVYVSGPDWGALFIAEGCDNSTSVYQDMYFWINSCAFSASGGVRAYDNFAGLWIDCVANGASFRIGWGDRVTQNAIFSARMYRCDGGPQSFIGDSIDPPAGTAYADNAYFEQCKTKGATWDSPGGGGFAGCFQIGTWVKDTCWFVECESGDGSFGPGVVAAGNYIRCRGGAGSFGSTRSNIEGEFSGYAEDCIAGEGSFGGTSVAGKGKCTGTLVRCTIEGNIEATRLEGATIRDSRLTNTTTGKNLLTLLDSNSQITNSDLYVFAGGTGVPIHAASALNVSVAQCRMNNGAVNPTGLHSNVTNIAGTPHNVMIDWQFNRTEIDRVIISKLVTSTGSSARTFLGSIPIRSDLFFAGSTKQLKLDLSITNGSDDDDWALQFDLRRTTPLTNDEAGLLIYLKKGGGTSDLNCFLDIDLAASAVVSGGLIINLGVFVPIFKDATSWVSNTGFVDYLDPNYGGGYAGDPLAGADNYLDVYLVDRAATASEQLSISGIIEMNEITV